MLLRPQTASRLKGLMLLPMLALLAACSTVPASGNQPAGRSPEMSERLAHSVKVDKTRVSQEAPYYFAAMGDWGCGSPYQKQVADQLSIQYKKQPFDAMLLLGDNIYPVGNIKRFAKPYFTDMYPTLIENKVHFITALGNHDRAGGFENDQISFFKMPDYFYKVHKPMVDFFVIDTNLYAKDKKQQEWLDKELDASKTPWKIVMGHHPIYSSGEHGNNLGLKATLEPLLVKHHVPLYLAGHDHNYERMNPINNIHYVISGGGGAWPREFAKIQPQSAVHIKGNEFLSFMMTPTLLEMKTIDTKGQVIDTLQLNKEDAKNKKKMESLL